MANRRRRRKKWIYTIQWGRVVACMGALAAVICLAVFLPRLLKQPVRDVSTGASPQPQTSAEPAPSQDAALQAAVSPGAIEQPLSSPDGGGEGAAPSPSPQPSSGTVQMLPILQRSTEERNDRKLALTVDDCFQTENLWEIVTMADQYGFKITFFPIGHVAKKNPAVWNEIHKRGHEIENHSYSHTNITKLTHEEALEEIVKQNEVINECLGVNYEMHFFRPMGGTGRREEWLHEMLRDLRYFGVAHWKQSGSNSAQYVLDHLQSGQIILFHTTNKDLEKLRVVIPGAIERGYEFVTLNEMYGLPANATSPLEP